MRKKFTRRATPFFSRLGKNRKKKQIWRKPKGRDNKMRERRRGRDSRPEVGLANSKQEKGKILGFRPMLVSKIEQLKKVGKENIVIIAKMGKRKRQIIMQEAEKLGLKILRNEKSKVDAWRKRS